MHVELGHAPRSKFVYPPWNALLGAAHSPIYGVYLHSVIPQVISQNKDNAVVVIVFVVVSCSIWCSSSAAKRNNNSVKHKVCVISVNVIQ